MTSIHFYSSIIDLFMSQHLCRPQQAKAFQLANVGDLGDSADEDADAVGPEVFGHRRTNRHDDDVGSGLSLMMISLASLMVSPTTSGHEVFFHPQATSYEEIIVV